MRIRDMEFAHKEETHELENEVDKLEKEIELQKKELEWTAKHVDRHSIRAQGYEEELFRIYKVIAGVFSGRESLEALKDFGKKK